MAIAPADFRVVVAVAVVVVAGRVGAPYSFAKVVIIAPPPPPLKIPVYYTVPAINKYE